MRSKLRLTGLLLIALLLIAAALPAGAQSKTIPFAAITQNQLVLYGMSDTPTVVQLPGEYQAYRSPVWSPDGQELIVMAADQNYNWQLLMIHTDGTPPTVILNEIPVGLPVNFTPEGYVLWAQDTGEVDTTVPVHSPILEVMTGSRQAPIGSLGRFTYGTGCGGGSSIPAHWLYWSETSSGPGNSPQVLAVTPFGVVHSINCTGRGVALLDSATGTDTVLHNTLGWVSISPDGSQLAGLIKGYDDSIPGQMFLLDLATQTTTELPVVSYARPDQVFWGVTNNDLYYTTIATAAQIPADEAAQQQLGELLGYMGKSTLSVNDVEIHHLDLVTNTERTLYTGPAFAIGRLAVMPDGSGILFSEIPNLNQWVDALLAGKVGADGGVGLLPIILYYLDTDANTLSTIAMDTAQFAFNAGAYTAQ